MSDYNDSEHYSMDLERDSGNVSVGKHLFKIVSVKEKMGPSGYPNWNFDCVCQDKGPDQGLHISLNVSHSPAASWKRNEFLDAMKMPRKGKVTSALFIGKLFYGIVEMGSYNDSPRAEIKNCSAYENTVETTVATLEEVGKRPAPPPPAPKVTGVPKDTASGEKAPF